ncbi:EAL domain-containing protein [Roseateles sp. BYS180W]|uniref:EAL domain-containing protein n=1 Tax=Roseateles rivi TaxID=3299028 RepID=A0ABW7FYH3_9BURK
MSVLPAPVDLTDAARRAVRACKGLLLLQVLVLCVIYMDCVDVRAAATKAVYTGTVFALVSWYIARVTPYPINRQGRMLLFVNCIAFPLFWPLRLATLQGLLDYTQWMGFWGLAVGGVMACYAYEEFARLESRTREPGVTADAALSGVAVCCGLGLALFRVVERGVAVAPAEVLVVAALLVPTIVVLVGLVVTITPATGGLVWSDLPRIVMVLGVCVMFLSYAAMAVAEQAVGGDVLAAQWSRVFYLATVVAGTCSLWLLLLPQAPPPAAALPVGLSQSSRTAAALCLLALPLGHWGAVTFDPAHLPPADAYIIAAVLCMVGLTARLMALVLSTARLRDEFRFQALHDPLTGLLNMRAVSPHFGQREKGDGPEPLVICIDLDDFKSINDLYGHLVGDALLIQVAHRLRDLAQRLTPRLSDAVQVARIGGDEFLMLLPGLHDEGMLVADMVSKELDRWWLLGEHRIYARASVGWGQHADWVQARKQADERMYAEKRHAPATPLLPEPANSVQRQRMREWLHGCLQNAAVVVALQPVVSLQHGGVVWYEALARLQHPEQHGRLLFPREFMDVVRSDGRHEELFQAVAYQLMQARSRWEGLKVSINIEPSYLQGRGRAQTLHEVLSKAGLSPHELTIELVESTELEGPALREALLQLRELGYTLALDDFGVGHSNLMRLMELPITVLKVDASLLQAAVQGDESLILAVMRVAQQRGLTLVVEGVSDARHRDVARRLGVDFAQGFVLGLPQLLRPRLVTA